MNIFNSRRNPEFRDGFVTGFILSVIFIAALALIIYGLIVFTI